MGDYKILSGNWVRTTSDTPTKVWDDELLSFEKEMKKYINLDFVPFIGIGLGTQRTQKGRELLIFLPFIVIELVIKNISK